MIDPKAIKALAEILTAETVEVTELNVKVNYKPAQSIGLPQRDAKRTFTIEIKGRVKSEP